MNNIASNIPVHLLLASLARGGAERIVCETLTSLDGDGFSANLFLLYAAHPCYQLPPTRELKLIAPPSDGDREHALKRVVERVLDSGQNLLITHLIRSHELEILWHQGLRTVPVIHNTFQGWQDDPVVFAHPLVPFVAATSLAVAHELREAQCPKPIVVVRHELQQWFNSGDMQQDRRRIRTEYGIGEREFVVGMVGNFKAQKAYPRAVRVLERLRRLGPARLLIVGSWDHSYGYGGRTYEATCRLAQDLGVSQDLIVVGSVDDVKPFYAAFDAFLNTSIFEGLSIAMLEAQQSGCPIVTADVGGNKESLGSNSAVVDDVGDIQDYVEALRSVRHRRTPPLRKPAYSSLIPRLWRQLALYSTPADGERVLFVTDSLNNGGATHSLVRLLTRLPDKSRVVLCVLGRTLNDFLFEELKKASIQMIQFKAPVGVVDCVERVLESMHGCDAGTLCFWNVDSCVKLLVTKVLSAAKTKIVDVSPGPCIFEQMKAAETFQHRIAFSTREYFMRLDRFVAKYDGGVPTPEYDVPTNKILVIRNGVPCAPENEQTPLFAGFAEAFRLITCGRLVPEKRVELIIDSAAEVAKQLPEISLTVVGAAERAHDNYAESLARHAGRQSFHNTWFAGLQPRVSPYLNAARIFVTASTVEGCSNAVLEAMSARLPVVATSNTAIVEQVADGVTGFIVNANGSTGLAEKISLLLRNPDMAHSFGVAGRRRVIENFGIDRMVKEYANALGM
ncbi:glycosyltransferase family 4 protein [Tunturiibacter lichenicola]|uniref:glycosyltransferase family 4 protein n=1 Tax=Tunturiibacter lichenicola TaxID=2051959 RepID=UPI003D9BED7A